MKQTADLESMLKRLDRLERSNRLWRGLSLLALATLGVGLLAAAGEPPVVKDSIVAKDFRLVDAAGKLRARLFMTGNGHPALSLMDENAKERINVLLTNEGPRFACLNEKGDRLLAAMGVGTNGGYMNLWNPQNQLCFSSGAKGVTVTRLLEVIDEKERVRVSAGVVDQSDAGLALRNPKGTPQLYLGLNQQGPALTCYDATGKIMLLQAGSAANARCGFVTGRNEDNEAIFGLNASGLFTKK
jgi:hypothetical protein